MDEAKSEVHKLESRPFSSILSVPETVNITVLCIVLQVLATKARHKLTLANSCLTH